MNAIFRKKTIILLYAGVLSFAVFSCKEDLGNVGLNIQPEDELLNTLFFDTATLVAYSAKNDSVITSGVSQNLLGDIQDIIFGRTQAAIYTQFRLSGDQVNFKDSAYVDSLILNLVYGGYYGDTTQLLRIRVYELDEDLNRNTVYRVSSTAKRKSEVLAEVQIRPMPNTHNDTATSAAYFSIPLSKSFAENKFLSQSDSSNLANDANFVRYFKGLYIEAEAVSSDGCMLSINLLDASSSMILYYGNKEKPGQSFYFNINDSCVRFSHINHFDYADADANLLSQLNGDYSTTKEVLYGQSAGGIKTVIQFPYLKEMFAGKQVVIHKAELLITRKDDNLPNYSPPVLLSLNYDRSETEKEMRLPDAILASQLSWAAYFGGDYDEATQQYAFRITKYIQDIVNGIGDDYKLNLVVPSAAIRLSRSQFYGTDPANEMDKDKRMKLKIHYTIINE